MWDPTLGIEHTVATVQKKFPDLMQLIFLWTCWKVSDICFTSLLPHSQRLGTLQVSKEFCLCVHRAEERSEESSLILDTFISTMRHSSAIGWLFALISQSHQIFCQYFRIWEWTKNIQNVGNDCPSPLFILLYHDIFQENLLFLWASHHESTSQLGWRILRGKREYCLRVWIFKSNSCVTFSGELTSLYLSFLIFRRRIIPVPSPRIVVKVKRVNLSPSDNHSSQPIKVLNKDQKVLIFPLPLYLPFSVFSSFTKAAQYTQLLMPET